MTIYCTNQSLGHNSGKRLILQKTTCRRNGTRGYWHLRAFSKHSVANGFIFSVIIHVQCHSRENIMKSIWLSIKAHANLYCIYIIDKRWSAANFCGSNINDKIKWNENNSKHIQNCSTLINGILTVWGHTIIILFLKHSQSLYLCNIKYPVPLHTLQAHKSWTFHNLCIQEC